MTIKRRIFLSNTLMVLIPTLTIIFLAAIFIFILNTTGVFDLKQLYKRDMFGIAVRELEELNEHLPESESALKNDVESFNDKYKTSITLYVYRDEIPVFTDFDLSALSQDFLDTALNASSESITVSSSGAIYCIDNGEYRFVLLDTDYKASDIINQGQNIKAGFWIMFAAALIVLFVDWLLTKYVINSITKPLNVLKKGVHEIGDGKLAYRIQYKGNDEFAAICSDFNEMAKRLQSHVEQRQKDMENRKELIAGISHDLRTPLTSIKAYLEGIEKGVASTDEQKERYMNMVKKKSTELEHIINQLFLFSKIDIGEFPFRIENVDMVSFIKDYCAIAAEEYKSKGLDVYFSYGNDEIYVDIDILQFKNVLTNISENSLKYKNKKNGRLDISYKVISGNVCLRFADDGPGVNGEALDKIFDVFYRADPSRQSKGSGLGLAISAKTMERLGGSIRAINGENGGLIIELTLPITEKWEKI